VSIARLSREEIKEITGYTRATKALNVLQARGFHRAFIDREGQVVLERPHFEAISRGEAPPLQRPAKVANLAFLRAPTSRSPG
jgi:hypothetical protein